MNRTILIMAGGTGGHVFPALAVAEALRQRGAQVHWLGSRGGFEEAVVAAAGFPLSVITVRGLRGKGWLGWSLAPLRLLLAVVQALAVFLRIRPDAVLGMGGFVAGPGGLVAWLLRRPLLVHEQNARPGLTNRMLAPLADRVMVAFDGVLAGRRTRLLGNPVRTELLALPPPQQRFAGRDGPLNVLIVGGSLGAQVLNESLPALLAACQQAGRCRIRHQVGSGRGEAVQASYRSLGVEAEVCEFIDDMAAAYGWADLIVCRAGALTVSEIMVVGIAALLVPYPYAVDDHQRFNAEPLVAAGAAEMVVQDENFEHRLPLVLHELLAAGDLAVRRRQLLTMAEAARTLARPDATAKVSEYCLEVANA